MKSLRLSLVAATAILLSLIGCGGGGSGGGGGGGGSSNIAPKASINNGNTFLGTGSQNSIQGFGSDDNGDPLTYKWMLKGKPVGSSLTLGTIGLSQFLDITPDVSGEYLVSLVVSDGKSESTEVSQTLVANAMPKLDFESLMPSRRAILLGQSIILNSGNITDADGDPVTAQWRLVEKPVGSQQSISSFPSVYNFSPDVSGSYIFELSASDGKQGVTWGERLTIDVRDVDREGPTFAFLSNNLNNGRVDLSSSSFELIVKIALNDATGVLPSVFEYLDLQTGNFAGYRPFAKLWGAPDVIDISSVQRVLGDSKQGVYEIKVTLPINAQRGRWAFSAGFIYDALGNSGGEAYFEFYVD